MPKIQLTNGRDHRRNNGDPIVVNDGPLEELQSYARKLVDERQRDNGLPDGYLIADDEGKEHAWGWKQIDGGWKEERAT